MSGLGLQTPRRFIEGEQGQPGSPGIVGLELSNHATNQHHVPALFQVFHWTAREQGQARILTTLTI